MPINDEQLARFAVNPIFVETGIHLGKTLARVIAMPHVQRYYGIEADKLLAAKAASMILESTATAQVQCGDSAALLRGVLAEIVASDQRCTFWLDAHGNDSSNPFPLAEELKAMVDILTRSDHTIMIDDVRSFSKKYSLNKLRIARTLRRINPNYVITYEPWDHGKFKADEGFMVARPEN
jgi:hypothetical protein